VAWNFERKGQIVINNEDEELDEDTVMMDALEAGADDLVNDGDVFIVYCATDALVAVSEALEKAGYTFESAEEAMIPNDTVKLEKEGDIKNMEKIIELLEEDDDVQNVWHNWDM
jgi:transcriptional/translational regulatory protein YebC/TACO1